MVMKIQFDVLLLSIASRTVPVSNIRAFDVCDGNKTDEAEQSTGINGDMFCY